MGPNPFIGVLYHWIGGFASATNFIPFRGIKRWSWEIYWLIQGFAAWIVAPLVLAGLLVPNLFGILHAAPHSSIHYALLWGALWGVGGLTFGLAIRYLGIALGYAMLSASAPPSERSSRQSTTARSTPSCMRPRARSYSLASFSA